MASRTDEHSRLRSVPAAHDAGSLLPAELGVPRRPATGTVPRPRLLDALDRGLAEGSVVVSAPAGSGKTTLVADWARHQGPPGRVAWLTLGSAERDPGRFVEHARAALDGAIAGRGGGALLPTPLAPGRVDESYLAAVARQLSAQAGQVVLVLDDFHHVVGSDTERMLKRILRHSAEPFRLAVLSRAEPSLGQTRLRLRGQLQELGPADLALTVDETAALLALHGAARLTSAEVASLHERTLGWVTGLETVTPFLGPEAATGGQDPVEQAVRAARWVLSDYVESEVLEDLPPEIVDFLHRAATADEVCGDLVDALTGSTGGGGTLADLYRGRIFLESDSPRSDEHCTWYRWNPLVAGALRDRLRDQEPDLAVELHRVASRWFRTHGATVEAVRHAIAGGDPDTASEALCTRWFDLAAAGATGALRSVLSLLGDARLATDPELLVIEAFVALDDQEPDRATRAARRAQDAVPVLPDDRRTAVEAAAAAVRLRSAGLTGRPDAADLYPSALALLDRVTGEQEAVTRPARMRRALLLHALGTFELSEWRYAEATDHLTDALAEAASLRMTDLLSRVRAQLATVEVCAGRLRLARSGASDVLDAAHHGDRPGAQAHTVAHLAVAAVDLHRGDADAALASLRLARVALHAADRLNDTRIRLHKHAALLLRGRAEAAAEELDALRESLAFRDVPAWVRLTVAVAEADQLRASGRPDDAPEVLEAVAALAIEPFSRQLWCNAYAQALLDAGRPAEARTLAAQVVTGDGDRALEVEAVLLDALAAQRLGLPEESLRSLTRAVRLSRREHIVRPFLLRSPQAGPLLEALAETGTGYEDHVRQILARLGRPDSDGEPRPLEPLTARELAVLRAMRGSASNDQIAAELFVSLNTLRSHIKQIHRKLGTANRREAVARARRLHLV